MKLWRVTPLSKQTVFETQKWTKEGESNYVMRELTWRWAEFIFETEDAAPTITQDVDMFNSGYNLVRSGFLHETSAKTIHYNSDGELLSEESVPPGNSPSILEDDGWVMSPIQVYINGDVNMELIEDEV